MVDIAVREQDLLFTIEADGLHAPTKDLRQRLVPGKRGVRNHESSLASDEPETREQPKTDPARRAHARCAATSPHERTFTRSTVPP